MDNRDQAGITVIDTDEIIKDLLAQWNSEPNMKVEQLLDIALFRFRHACVRANNVSYGGTKG